MSNFQLGTLGSNYNHTYTNSLVFEISLLQPSHLNLSLSDLNAGVELRPEGDEIFPQDYQIGTSNDDAWMLDNLPVGSYTLTILGTSDTDYSLELNTDPVTGLPFSSGYFQADTTGKIQLEDTHVSLGSDCDYFGAQGVKGEVVSNELEGDPKKYERNGSTYHSLFWRIYISQDNFYDWNNQDSRTKPGLIFPSKKDFFWKVKSNDELWGTYLRFASYLAIKTYLPGLSAPSASEISHPPNNSNIFQPSGSNSNQLPGSKSINEIKTEANRSDPRKKEEQIYIVRDYDNDGDLDRLLTKQNFVDIYGRLDTTAVIYQNNGYDIFVDIGIRSAFAQSISIDWGDYDNDGDLDILFSGLAENGFRNSRIYRNDGDNGFSEVDANIEPYFSGWAEWIDYDRDYDLDVLISGVEQSESSSRLPQSRIYRNNGNDEFSDVDMLPASTENIVCSTSWILEPDTCYWNIQTSDINFTEFAFSREGVFVVATARLESLWMLEY